jgi:hypothetical protein
MKGNGRDLSELKIRNQVLETEVNKEKSHAG